eukprot:CAMPEP_0182554990 /NCGR_PEP_ID=MMETSP1323-20130603/50262_1 /TAXON_ID=236787 /ORGANISM="Florenciella parvula, Strain RCC1693" /LENGTH=414 /DNA_ID=CAMNT_0024766717 /DNA_START=210 /DNA_END=1454 /DNA_ORIENTATION=-
MRGLVRALVPRGLVPDVAALAEGLYDKVAPGTANRRVGVRTFRNSHGAAIRVYYPAVESQGADGGAEVRVSVFRNSLSTVVNGYFFTFFGWLLPSIVVTMVQRLLGLVVWLHPLDYSYLPRCAADLPVEKGVKGKYPLVVWSHGLTGTGCEHGVLATALALRGNVVAILHHSCGSSSGCDLVDADGTQTFLTYDHPSMKEGEYPLEFRQKQAEHRAREMDEARELLLAGGIVGGGGGGGGGAEGAGGLKDLSNVLDPNKVVAGGFSFGAATAGLAASTDEAGKPCAKYCAAVLIDGWWHIALKKAKVNVDLPRQAHERGIAIPSLFIGSDEFQGYADLKDGTDRLQAKVPDKSVHVMSGTRHGNFMDAIWWLPKWVTCNLGFSGKTVDPHQTYAEFVGMVADFVDERADRASAK